MIPTLSVPLLSWMLAAGPQPASMIDVQPGRRVEAELTYSYRYADAKVREWIICAAQPPELPGQTRLTITMEPGAQVRSAREASSLQRPVLMLSLMGRDNRAQRFEVKVRYQATLRPRRLVALTPGKKPPPVAALTAAEESAALAASPLADYSSTEFQRWLDVKKLRRRPAEDEIDFARRVFRGITTNFTYLYLANQDRHVSKLCDGKSTDCGGMSLLFVATLRANNLPARTLAGRWAQSSKPDERGVAFYQTHVKAEFYARGVGWVPVDLSSAVLHDKSKEGLRYFGNDLGDFLTMHVDTDLVVDTVLFKQKTVHWVQGVAFWASGTGNFKEGTATEDWQVRKLP